nr:hypothetical protein [Tanacetum cinerariifolium]
MSTHQDIYAASSKARPPMLNKENYVPWSSRLFCYAKSRPNKKVIYNSIMIGPYVRRMILELGDLDREVPVNETFHKQTDAELTKKELKHVEADDKAIQTILLGIQLQAKEFDLKATAGDLDKIEEVNENCILMANFQQATPSGMFRINPFKTSRKEKPLPNKIIKASVRTKPIIVSQPHVISKKDVNSDSNAFSSTRVDNTTKTRRP